MKPFRSLADIRALEALPYETQIPARSPVGLIAPRIQTRRVRRPSIKTGKRFFLLMNGCWYSKGMDPGSGPG
jgi:hypothetical protein